MKRRGEYRHIWRTTTFAITWATLLSMLAEYLPINSTIISVFFFITDYCSINCGLYKIS
ncbi:hypothetical protein OL548_27195 [Lysinibacillus sp. MHQ-1]|nr:hypothetical protein OL548_27195 [Lysinibacillus sp. MHQ-1]